VLPGVSVKSHPGGALIIVPDVGGVAEGQVAREQRQQIRQM